MFRRAINSPISVPVSLYLAGLVGTMALVLVAIGAVRALVVYLPFGDNRVWAAHLIVGGIFVFAGLLLFRMARPREAR